MHTLAIINPGHFHAGLVLREMQPSLSPDVYIYSEAGPDLDNFLKLANAFNERKERPTHWVFHLHAGGDYLAKAIADRKADIAVLAGRNDKKIFDIAALHEAGFKILSDKPLTIDGRGVAELRKILAGGEVLMDIMTERHEVTSLIQRELLKNPEVFGEFKIEAGRYAIEKESVHYFIKQVNGMPLVRPAWYMDVTVQGEGLVDVTTHLADLVQWMLGDRAWDFERDVEMIEARAWDTLMSEEKFRALTKTDGFQSALADRVRDGVLHIRSNGEFGYKLGGVPVRLKVVWDLEPAAGGGDTHDSVIRGTRSSLEIKQGPETGGKPELSVVPATGVASAELESAVKNALASSGYAGCSVRAENGRLKIDIPAELRTTHEMHFAAVRDEFLSMVDGGAEPADLRSNLLTKYATLAAARDLAAGVK